MIAEINGTIRYGEVSKGLRKIHILPDMVDSKSHGLQSGGEEKEYSLPRGVHINVQEGEKVKAGDPLMDGPRNPHDILSVLGEKELQKHNVLSTLAPLVNEIQEVYLLQGVNINDKHLEAISRQMMRWIKIEDSGDTDSASRKRTIA